MKIFTSATFKTLVFLYLAIFSFSVVEACGWSEGGMTTATIAFGNVYIPRDAKNGSVIGTPEKIASYSETRTSVRCTSRKALSLRTNLALANVNGVAVAGGYAPLAGTVYKTNVNGVGVVFSIDKFFQIGTSSGSYFTAEGSYPYAPMFVRAGVIFTETVSGMPQFFATLVKTGDIAPGSTDLRNVTATVGGDNQAGGVMAQIKVTGTVIRSECTLAPGADLINVSMGKVSLQAFKGQGSTLDSHPFQIPLTDCTAGSYPNYLDGNNVPWNYYTTSSAHLRLEGAKGSAILNAAQGTLGLNSDSTASGLGVQILQQDGITPVPLGTETKITRLTNGAMMLSLKARYIQTSDKVPTAGTANASARFTITYK